MMQVSDLKAEPNERGGRIDLSWVNPTDAGFAGVKVLRREARFADTEPASVSRWQVHDEPVAATPAGLAAIFVDQPLQGETVYYYTVIPYDATAQLYAPSFASAMATAPYQTATHLYNSLPGLYRNFDTVLPPAAPGLDAQERTRGQLRRLVEMFGLQFDLLRSFAGGMRNFTDVAQVDGALLPLLAQWIDWPTNNALDFEKQRNEIKYAPHFYRTTGVPANTRATINRLITWDARLKEFVHNVFLATYPEQLTIWEAIHRDGAWHKPQSVTLDIAYEGRPATLLADQRQWLFYHARQSAPHRTPGQSGGAATQTPAPDRDNWYIFFKTYNEYGWTPSRRIQVAGQVNKYPAAVQDLRGNLWLFWSAYEEIGGKLIPQIKLHLFSVGRDAHPPRISGMLSAPFALADGDEFTVIVNDTAGSHTKQITFFGEVFQDITHATAQEVAAYLNREMQGIDVTVGETDNLILTATSKTAGAIGLVGIVPGLKLGLTGLGPGQSATAARLVSHLFEPFNLAPDQTLTLRVDGGRFLTISFTAGNLPNIANATAADVAAVINNALPDVARVVDEAGQLHIELVSPTTGSNSLVEIDVDASTAAPALGFGARLPTPSGSPLPDDTEPAAFVDSVGGVWLFWSSRRGGGWQIWYNRCDVAASVWGTAKALTPGPLPDREPMALFDPAGIGRIWVFWARKQLHGRWNVSYRTTDTVNFTALNDGLWSTAAELTTGPADCDNREPFGILPGTGAVELYFTSNRQHGWQVWTKIVNVGGQGTDTQITDGQFSRRAPIVLSSAGRQKLYFRSNESLHYTSSFYPASQTIDARYSGATTVDTRNRLKIGLRLNIEDVQRYTYDTRKGQENWYARDTVGVYLNPDTNDQLLVVRRRNQIEAVLRRFLPMPVRPVFIIDQLVTEYFYTYDNPTLTLPTLIGERPVDTILSVVFKDTADLHFSDTADFFWLRAWDKEHTKIGLPDLSVTPPDLSVRLPIVVVGEPESGG
jgi:hypothetical protein